MDPFVNYYHKATINPKTFKAKCFHIIGFDVLIDSKLNAWLLEINNNPSLNILNESDAHMSGRSSHDINPVDLYIKSRVVENAIKLRIKNDETIKSTDIFNDFYTKIVDGDCSAFDYPLL